MRNYNFDLAKKIIDTFVDLGLIDEASIGMHEDWFWTAETLYENGEYRRKLISNEEAIKLNNEYIQARKDGMSIFDRSEKYDSILIAGIYGSDWATPVLSIELNNGDTRTFNCFIGESESDVLTKIEREFSWTGGVLSRPVQEARDSIEVEEFKG